MGIIMIARVYGGRKHVGYRLLDTSTKHVKDVNSASVLLMLSRGGEIDNIEIVGDVLECTYEDINKYPSIVDGYSYDGNVLILVDKVGYDSYAVCDWRGTVVEMSEQKIIGYTEEYGLLNGKIVSIPLGEGFNTIIKKVTKFNVGYEDIVKRYRKEVKELRASLKNKADTFNIKSDVLELSCRITDEFELELKEGEGFTSESIKIPGCVERIGNKAFKGIRTVKTISGGDNLLEVGQCAFEGCNGLVGVDLSKSKITEIPYKLFFGCSELREVKLPDNIISIGIRAFGSTSIGQLTIPDGTKQILAGSFRGCAYISEIKWGSNLKYIGKEAFVGNTLLKSVRIPDGVEIIDNAAFKGCENLEEMYIPSSVTTLKKDFVDECDKLIKLELPKKLAKSIKVSADTEVITY